MNIIRPAGAGPATKLPVAVWIHGGGLRYGGANDRKYNMSWSIQRSQEMGGQGFIGVRIQHRLTAFGFLAGSIAKSKGIENLGFKDQRLALHWIQDNIEAFGGDPTKVTLFGESAGAQSIGAQLLAYNGRDDKLFRGAIMQSGGPTQLGAIRTAPGTFNNTAVYQAAYNWLVNRTECGDPSTEASLDCMRQVPLSRMNSILNGTGVPSFGQSFDGEFVADYPSAQLAHGDFVRVPIITGCNSAEGTFFANGYGPNGGVVDTDADFRSGIAQTIPDRALETLGKTRDEIVNYIATLYPDINAAGQPSMEWHPSANNTDGVRAYGRQWRRIASFVGDAVMIAPRTLTAQTWASRGVPVWSFRFDVKDLVTAPVLGPTHFQEVAFMFRNLLGEGYPRNPLVGGITEENERYRRLAGEMNDAWIRFIVHANPNGACKGDKREVPIWPRYNPSVGGVGQNIVWTANSTSSSYLEWDIARAAGIKFINGHSLDIFGK